MVQLNLTTAYASINYVKVTSINIDPIAQKIYAAVYYFFSKNNQDRVTDPVYYNYNAERVPFERIPATVILEGADYTAYNTYVNQGKSPEAAVLQILVDKAVLSGTIV